MLEATQCVDGLPAAPYAWFSNTRDGRVIVQTWRNKVRPGQDLWQWKRDDSGQWINDPSLGGTLGAEWRKAAHYTALLNAFDDQSTLHGGLVYATLSTDVGAVSGPAKMKAGENVLIKNRDGTPALFRVAFDKQLRWHRLTSCELQDADIAVQ